MVDRGDPPTPVIGSTILASSERRRSAPIIFPYPRSRPTETATPIHEGKLAWALIEAAKPDLTVGERHHVFVTVGAGDTFDAIRFVITTVAAKHIPLRPRLAQLCAAWLDAYALSDEYEYLRSLVEAVVMPTSVQCADDAKNGLGTDDLTKSTTTPTVRAEHSARRLPAAH